MSKTKTYEISLPLSEKDYIFLKDYIDNPKVDINDDIREVFYQFKSHDLENEHHDIFDQNDYSKFINKLKEKKFIEQFENGFGDFNTTKFYVKLERAIKKENILFNRNYDTSKKQTKIIDDLVSNILVKYFEDDNPRWLIRAYIVGRAIYYSDKYKTYQSTLKEILVTDEAKKISLKHNLSLELAKRIDVSLDYSSTTIKCLTKGQIKIFRKIIIEEYFIRNEPISKLVDKIHEFLTNDDVFLLNIDWQSAIRDELNFIDNKARLELKPSNSYVICMSFKGCCDHCSKDIVGKVFKVADAPKMPYEKCAAETCLCTLLPFNPEYQYVSTDGQTRLKVENEKEWKLWYLKNFVLINAK